MWQVLQEYLGSKYLALLLDNFEHVLAGAPLLVELLTDCPWLSLLLTSRWPCPSRPHGLYPRSQGNLRQWRCS